MIPTTAAGAADRLRARLDLLREVLELADDRLPRELTGAIEATVQQADTRLGHGTAHTVVAIAGATGGGKSTLFNALVGTDVADVGVRRPTTATAQAAVFGGGADGLLDWLQVPRRHVVAPSELDGLVLLDLPDHDSVAASHRDEVDRLAQVVDTFVWVVDPQKYADAALHQQYLARFAAHGAVTVVVLNQVDTVTEPERAAMLDDLKRLIGTDGLVGVRTIAASARTGDGVPSLRRELAARVSARQALVARLDADVDWLIDDLRAAVGDAEPAPLGRAAVRRLEDAAGYASGVDPLADAVGAAHRHRAIRQVGWPPLRWLRGLRPDPLRRLGLDRSHAQQPPESDAVPRTSRPTMSAVSDAAIDEALRGVAADASRGMPDLWVARVHDVMVARRPDVADALDVAVSSARLRTDPPRWWAVASMLQWIVTGVMAVGLLWLLVIGIVAWFRLPDLPTPDVRRIPLPTLLALGGAVAGWLVAGIARWATGVGAHRRAAAARRALHAQVADAVRTLVVDPVDAELAALGRLQHLARRLDR